MNRYMSKVRGWWNECGARDDRHVARTPVQRTVGRASTVLIAMLVGTASAQNGSASNERGARDWQTATSLQVRYFGWIGSLKPEDIGEHVSPDGRYFLVPSWHGEPRDDSVVQKLEIYDTAQVQRWLADRGARTPLPPVATVERKLVHRLWNGSVRDLPVWGRDSTALTFAALDEAGISQLYRLKVPSGTLEQLSEAQSEVLAPNVQGDSILYFDSVPEARPATASYPMLALPRDARGVQSLKVGVDRVAHAYARYRGGAAWALPQSEGVYINGVLMNAWFSRDGRYAVMLAWAVDPENSAFVPQKFVLVDLEKREARDLGESGTVQRAGVVPEAFWSSDGEQVIVANVRPRADGDSEGATAASRRSIAAYDVRKKQWQILETLQEVPRDLGKERAGVQRRHPGDARQMGWSADRETLLIAAADPRADGSAYRREQGKWIGEAIAAEALQKQVGTEERPQARGSFPEGLKVEVRQSANDPPQLIVSDGRREKSLSQPDPVLQGVWRARVEPFKWRDSDGVEYTGGLSLPRHGQKPYPLVIQVCYDQSNLFIPDGPVMSAFARQGLNARGMAVLSLDAQPLSRSKKTGTAQEGPGMVDQIDTAVEALSKQGLVDVKQVGLVGFSRTGWQVHYAVTHPKKTAFAAAEVFDAVKYDYVEYLLSSITVGVDASEATARINGATTFWQNKASWQEHDLLFNADRIEAATLFVGMMESKRGSGLFIDEHTPYNLAQIAALTLTDRPFDMLFIVDGLHNLTLPKQRQASLDATVDWMAFWLRGYEDPGESKAAQYVRWRQIRTRNEQRKATTKVSATHVSGEVIGQSATR